jgi:glyoxylase-like metal-dependent hydrolase (beta-lactamase superfamily II)
MRSRVLLVLFAFTTCGALRVAAARPPQASPAAGDVRPSVTLQKIADGVYAAIRPEPPGLMFDANSIFIVNDADVIVVDTNITPSSARASLAALMKLTNKPVTAVINTHWHDDHVIGNQVYHEVFPSAEFIAQKTTMDDLPTIGAANRKQLVEMGPLMVTQLQMSVEQRKSLTGNALTDEERTSYLSDIASAKRYFAEAPTMQVVMPTRLVDTSLTLARGKRKIEVLYLGRAHTSADLVVWLPEERIAITGDLVVSPIPLVGSTSHPLEFGATLEKLLAMKPAVLIPGHGPVMRDDKFVRQEVALLASLKSQVEASVARGDALAQARKSVNLDEFKRQFAGSSQALGFIFDNYVASSGVAAAYKDATMRGTGLFSTDRR